MRSLTQQILPEYRRDGLHNGSHASKGAEPWPDSAVCLQSARSFSTQHPSLCGVTGPPGPELTWNPGVRNSTSPASLASWNQSLEEELENLPFYPAALLMLRDDVDNCFSFHSGPKTP